MEYEKGNEFKMKSKRFLSLMLAGALLASVATGCGNSPSNSAVDSESVGSETLSENFNATGYPIVNEPVSISVAAVTSKNKEFGELEFFQNMEEQTNVHVDWQMASKTGWDEKKSLLFAGGTLPDAFYGRGILTNVDVVKYGAEGLLLPLEGLIEEYAPNFMKLLEYDPTVRGKITASDGHIYSLPNYSATAQTTHSKLFINKTWLDKLGLEVPETPEEFKAVLQAFKDNDMNGNGDATDEIPFTFRASDTMQQNLSPMFGAFGQLDTFDHFIVKDGKVLYTAMTDEWKNGIRYFHDLYASGLMDKEGFTQDANMYVSKVQDPEVIVGAFLGWSRSATAGPNKDEYVAIAPLNDENGNQIWQMVDARLSSVGAFAITKDCENPELLMRWIDTSYEPLMSLQSKEGLFGRALEQHEDGTISVAEIPEGMLKDQLIHDYAPGNDGVSAILKAYIEPDGNAIEKNDLDKFYAPYNVPLDEVYPNVLWSLEEIDDLAILQTDIVTYVSKCYADWIANGGIEEEWEEYLSKLEGMNVENYIGLYQQAYDRYMQSIA